MSIHPRDVLFYGGGAAWQKFGTLCQSRAPAFRGGEEIIETFARTGTAAFKDGSGVLRLAEANAPRVHWLDLDGDGVFETPALLLEDARTNAWTYSEQVDNAAWAKQECTITANDTTAPDGASTADFINPTAVDTTHYVQRSQTGLTDNTETTVSFFAKQEDQNWLAIVTVSKAATSATSFFNLATGAEGTQGGGHTTVIEPYGDGWYRISVTWDVESGGATPLIRITVCDADNDTVYLGVVGEGLYVWGIQIEDDKAFSSSYIQTVAVTATRNAELLSFPFYAPPQAISIYSKFVEIGTILQASGKVWFIGAADASNGYLMLDASTYYRAYYDDGASGVGSTQGAAPSIGDTVEVLCTQLATGAVQASQSIGEAAATTAGVSSALDLITGWGDALLHLNANGSSNISHNQLIAVIAARGSHSLADFRALLP